jgi:hypothetical protein
VSRVKTPLWFWAAIIIMRTAAANVGDAFHDFRMGFEISVPVSLVLFALTVALYARVTLARSPGRHRASERRVLGRDDAGGHSWHRRGRPGRPLVHGARRRRDLLRARGHRDRILRAPWDLADAAYWTAVGLVRTAGTAGSDTVAHTIGLAPGTVVTGVVFLALVILSSRAPARLSPSPPAR